MDARRARRGGLRRHQPGRPRAGQPPRGRRGARARGSSSSAWRAHHAGDPAGDQHPFITIAGQTAPGDGVCVRGPERPHQHARRRHPLPAVPPGQPQGPRRLAGRQPVGNVIIDHVSASWGLDENLSLYRHMDRRRRRAAAEAADREHHDPVVDLERGAEPQQPRLRRDLGRQRLLVPPQPLRLQHGPQPEHRDGRAVRLPQQRPVQLAAPDRSTAATGARGSTSWPTTSSPARPRRTKPRATGSARSTPARRSTSSPASASGMSPGNVVEGSPKVTADNWAGGVQFSEAQKIKDELVPKGDGGGGPGLRAVPAAPDRPAVGRGGVRARARPRRRIAPPPRRRRRPRHRIRAHGPPDLPDGIIDSPADVGGWPEYGRPTPRGHRRRRHARRWETQHGLDPNDPADSKKDGDGDGYTSIEEYLNGTDPTAFIDYTKPENNRNILDLSPLVEGPGR